MKNLEISSNKPPKNNNKSHFGYFLVSEGYTYLKTHMINVFSRSF